MGISRSSAYYQPKDVSEEDLAIMRCLDEIHMKYPCMGSRRLVWKLAEAGHKVSRNKILRLMRVIGIQTLYPKRKTTVANKKHKVYPYLLRSVKVTYPNQVWAVDVTYISMAKGFVYVLP